MDPVIISAAVAQFDDEVGMLKNAGIGIAFNVYEEAGAGLAAHVCGNSKSIEEMACS